MDEETEAKLDDLDGKINGFKVITDSLKKDIHSLKIQNGKVKTRIDIVENLDLQKQIFNLSERIDILSKEFKDKIQEYEHDLQQLQCYVCAVKVNEDVDAFSELLAYSKLRDKDDLHTQLVADASTARAEIFTSKFPNRIAVDFHVKWVDYLRSIGISFVNF